MAAARPVFDVLLRGGTVLDGTGSPPVRADVATRGERVAGVLSPGAVDEGAAQRVLNATFADPHQYAAGFEHVLVNGLLVIESGERTGALPGRVLRRGQD